MVQPKHGREPPGIDHVDGEIRALPQLRHKVGQGRLDPVHFAGLQCRGGCARVGDGNPLHPRHPNPPPAGSTGRLLVPRNVRIKRGEGS
jgi:hypothetical protein